MALNSQGLQSELSQVSVTFVCNEGTSSSTGARVVWCVLHSMRILWPSVHQLDSSSGGGPKVCPELCACWWGSNFPAPDQWGSEGTWTSADCEAVPKTASVMEGWWRVRDREDLSDVWSPLINQKQALCVGLLSSYFLPDPRFLSMDNVVGDNNRNFLGLACWLCDCFVI